MRLLQDPDFQPRPAHFVIDVIKIRGEFVFGNRGRNDKIGFDPGAETEAVDGPGVAFADDFELEAVVDVEFHCIFKRLPRGHGGKERHGG